MNRTIKTTLAIAATLVASLLAAPSAHAEDQRACVSKVEYQGMPGANTGINLTRTQVEARWDVAGLGWSTYVPWFSDGTGNYVMAYPRCGYNRVEAWYAAAYHIGSGNTRVWALISWRAPGATPHGNERNS